MTDLLRSSGLSQMMRRKSSSANVSSDYPVFSNMNCNTRVLGPSTSWTEDEDFVFFVLWGCVVCAVAALDLLEMGLSMHSDEMMDQVEEEEDEHIGEVMDPAYAVYCFTK